MPARKELWKSQVRRLLNVLKTPFTFTTRLKSGDIDLLTETDQQVERKLIDGLLAKFPGHK